MKRLITGVILITSLLLSVSCANSTPPNQEPSVPTVPTLENTTWVLQSYGQPGNLKTVLTGADVTWKSTEITAVFGASGRVTGSSGVNTYGGTYELLDNKLSITGITLTTLGGPQPLVDQETEFLKLLRAAESYQIKDSQLQINCGQELLIFAKKT